ncbi:glyceraldehyde-3-phosphate dehydrogenase 1 [Irineochytrium annulatum]|nr:glyceraldehyde-3-phosphate dehydrogenase 1 [Irineochytrium annulatum]
MSKHYPSEVAKAALIAAQNGLPLGTVTVPPNSAGLASDRASIISAKSVADRRYSVAALWSMAAENDVEVDDELTKAQRRLRELKSRISSQSKKNFLLERDVRYLDSRIALLIQNRMALVEQQEVASALEDGGEAQEGTLPDDRKRQLYGNLFFLLQSEPRHIATLARLVSLAEIDTLLQTVMFTIYGNQYESREEYLLLSMFQASPGQTYLKSVLSELINNLIEHKDLDLEINPLKVFEQMVADVEAETGQPYPHATGITSEQAAAHPDVQAIMAPRVQTLMEIAESFLAIIIGSIDQVPYGIRWICKQIKSLTKRKYPEATDFNICSLIGGFFMLRFVNPAIVTPQAYMLVDGNPSKHPRRTLTLIAKLLQNLANKPSYAKEQYMMILNPFVDQNKARINEFLNDLCEVGDFYEALEVRFFIGTRLTSSFSQMEQYIALSKKEIQLNITLNEMYNTHSLLVQHKDFLAPGEKDHLRICLNDLGPAPHQVPRAENKAVVLPLFSRWEQPITDIPSAIADSQLTQGDILYMDTKAIFVQILRSMPSISSSSAIKLYKITESACTARDTSLVKKGIKVKDMLSQLEEMGVVDSRDGHSLLVEEISQELVHLGNLKDKVNKEILSLEVVYKTIIDHNNYQRSQLESYKAYLQNVRVQSGMAHSKGGKGQVLGPFKFTHAQMERDGIIVESNVPENRRVHIFFNISSPVMGTFLIALHFKGRDKPILEMDLKLDDLLEKQQQGVQLLDLEYVQLSVNKVLMLLNKTFLKR